MFDEQLSWEQLGKWLEGFINKPLYMTTAFIENADDWDEQDAIFNNYFVISMVHHVICSPGGLHISGWADNEIFNYTHYKDTYITKFEKFVTIKYKGNYPNLLEVGFSPTPY